MIIETVNLTETSRLTVAYDQDADSPREWDGTLSSFEKLHDGGRRNPVTHPHGDSGELPDVYDAWNRFWVHADRVAVLERWAKIWHGVAASEFDYELGGLWYVTTAAIDTAGVVLDADRTADSVLWDELNEYRTWVSGEVYGVTLERKATWVRLPDADDDSEEHETRDTWEHEESVWGNYADEGQTLEDMAKATAREHFELTPEEKEATAPPVTIDHLFPGTTPADLADVLNIRGDAK